MKKLVNAIFGLSIIAISTISCQKENLKPTYIIVVSDTTKMKQFEDSVRKELREHSDTIYIQIKDTNEIDYNKPLTVTYDNLRYEYTYYETGEMKEKIQYTDNIVTRKITYTYSGKTQIQTIDTYDPTTGTIINTNTYTTTYK